MNSACKGYGICHTYRPTVCVVTVLFIAAVDILVQPHIRMHLVSCCMPGLPDSCLLFVYRNVHIPQGNQHTVVVNVEVSPDRDRHIKYKLCQEEQSQSVLAVALASGPT